VGVHNAALADSVPGWTDGWAQVCVCVSDGGEAVLVGVGWRESASLLARRRVFLSYLGGLRLDLTGTRERTVNLTHVGV
jgi:hypothetical protein